MTTLKNIIDYKNWLCYYLIIEECVKMKLNNKGFTLVELLAVIVILAVVMLIGVTAVGPLMARSRKSSLATEGLSAMKAAQTAYQAEQMNGTSAIKATSTVCFDLNYLYQMGYFEKGSGVGTGKDGYTGSILMQYDSSTKNYKYYIWISNATYEFVGIEPDKYNVDSDGIDDADGSASSNCNDYKGKGGTNKIANIIKCTGKTCAAA